MRIRVQISTEDGDVETETMMEAPRIAIGSGEHDDIHVVDLPAEALEILTVGERVHVLPRGHVNADELLETTVYATGHRKLRVTPYDKEGRATRCPSCATPMAAFDPGGGCPKCTDPMSRARLQSPLGEADVEWCAVCQVVLVEARDRQQLRGEA